METLCFALYQSLQGRESGRIGTQHLYRGMRVLLTAWHASGTVCQPIAQGHPPRVPGAALGQVRDVGWAQSGPEAQRERGAFSSGVLLEDWAG